MDFPQPIGNMSTVVPQQKVRDASAALIFGDSLGAGVDDSPPHGDPSFRWCLPLETALTAAFVGAGKTPPTYTNTCAASFTSSDVVADIVARLPEKLVYLTIFPINDVFFAIPTGTTVSNVRTILRHILNERPDALIAWGLPAYLQGENFPLGANANDAAITTMNNAVRAVLAEAEFAARVIVVDIQALSFALAPTVNPTHQATGVQTQALGTHPAKAGTRPAGVDAQSNWSNDFFAVIPLDLT
jgi:hypothetical protein